MLAVSRLSDFLVLVNNTNYASLFGRELEKLLLNNNIRASCRTICPLSKISNVTNNKSLQVFKNHNSESVSIFFRFVHQCLLLCLLSYFFPCTEQLLFSFTQSGGSSHCLNLINFVTQLWFVRHGLLYSVYVMNS